MQLPCPLADSTTLQRFAEVRAWRITASALVCLIVVSISAHIPIIFAMGDLLTSPPIRPPIIFLVIAMPIAMPAMPAITTGPASLILAISIPITGRSRGWFLKDRIVMVRQQIGDACKLKASRF